VTKSISIKPSSMWVPACQIAIGTTGMLWLYEGDALRFSVAFGALVLTICPRFVIRDLVIRDAASVITAVLLAAHVVFGMHGELYETSMFYDKAMHVLGSGAVAALLLLAVRRYCHRHLIDVPLVVIAVVVLGGTLSAGTLWELFEFAMDSTGLFHAQRGLHDTMLDLLADAGGGLILVAIVLSVNIHEIKDMSRTRQH